MLLSTLLKPISTSRFLIAEQALVLLVVCLTATGCGKPARTSPLIDRFRNASCVWPSSVSPNREWDETLNIENGSVIRILGTCGVSGTVEIAYGVDGPLQTAVDPGDYLCPRDVRVDDLRLALYVKAQ